MLPLATPLAIVDLETTGAHPARDRVTEIAVVAVDGFERASRWSTLVNPGRAIPGAVQALTGISQEMVESAPRFRDVAQELYRRLAGRLFVAHNAHFDYGFLHREFERAGLSFLARTLCTVRLSRRLYRWHARHDLDSLIARHGIACWARHRALGDADALWQFLRIAAREHGEEVVGVAARQVTREPGAPTRHRPVGLGAALLRSTAAKRRRHDATQAADWPYDGPIGIVEHDQGRDATEVHVIDRWCYLGTACSDAELAELLAARREPRFDLGHYRILVRHLARRGVRTVALKAPCTAN